MSKSNQTKAQGYEGLILRIMVGVLIIGGGAFLCNFGMQQIIELNSQPEGIVDGNLTGCSASACISSEVPEDDDNYIAPIALTASPDEAISILETVLPRLASAKIKEQTDGYFLVRVGGIFSDNASDLEVYVNEDAGEIQVKLEPFGANTTIEWTRGQVERLRELYEQELP